jgi:hypothetical protein
MPLTPTSGVSTGESLGQRLLEGAEYLTSGEKLATAIAPTLRKNRLTGAIADTVGSLYEHAPAPVRFLADNLLSPVGLASTIFAPVTGGTSLGLSGALGTAARLSTRLVPEALVAGGATLAAKGAQTLVPEDAPWWEQAGIPLLAGLAGGAAAGSAIKGAVRGATPAVARSFVADEAAAKGLTHVPGIANYQDIVNDVGSDSRLAGQILAKTGIDPSAAAESGSVAQKYLGLVRAQEVNTSEVALVLNNTFPNGAPFKVQPTGLVDGITTPDGLPVAMDTIMSDLNAAEKYHLNPEQVSFIDKAHEIAGEGGDIDKIRQQFGLRARPKVDVEGQRWWHREALTKDGKRMPRPSDPTEARMWDTEEEAIASGQPVNYADPMTNLAMQLKANLDEVHQHVFERDVIASGAGLNKAALATPQGQVQHGILKKAAIDLRRKTGELQDAIKESASGEIDPITGAPVVPEMNANLSSLQKAVTGAKDTYDDALLGWNKMVETKFSLLPASVVGGKGNELVPVKQWRGIEGKSKPAYIPSEDADAMAQWFNKAGLNGPNFKGIGGTAQQVGDVMRYFSATGDVAAPLMQGLPLLAHDPVSWAKMAASSYKSLFDPAVQGHYISNNYKEMADMIIKGRVPIGSSEAFAAIQNGGLGESLLTLGGRTNKALNVANKFERGYDTTLLITRAELWKSMRGHFQGSDEELGQVVRNLTGGMDTKGLGVGPTQRGLESMFLFAPKLLRSTLALVGQAAKPWTPGGQEAAHTLLRTMAAGAGTMALANIAIGMSNGESETEIEQRIADALNPLNGRQFLGVKVGDNWYGMGGQFRSATSLVYRGIVSPDKLVGLDSENPLVQYASGRLSPLAGLGLAGTELATHEKLDLLPFQTVDDFPDIAKLAGTGLMPFAMQSLIQNKGNVVPPIFEFFGARTSTITPTDALDAASQKQFGLDYKDLTGREQADIKAKNPDAVAAQEKLGGKAALEYRRITKENDKRVNDLLVVQANLVKEGKLDRRDFAQNVSDMMHDRFLRNEASREALGIDITAGDSPKRQVSDAYFATFKDAGYTPDGGQVDWNKWDALQANLQIDIKAGRYGDAARAQQYLDERTKFDPPPEAKWYFDNKDIIKEAGFYDQKEVAFEQIKPMVKSMGYDFQSENDLETAAREAVNNGDPRARQLLRLVTQVGTREERIHKQMETKSPELRKALVENGVISKPRRELGQPV